MTNVNLLTQQGARFTQSALKVSTPNALDHTSGFTIRQKNVKAVLLELPVDDGSFLHSNGLQNASGVFLSLCFDIWPWLSTQKLTLLNGRV
jgi:hypothetical protein